MFIIKINMRALPFAAVFSIIIRSFDLFGAFPAKNII
jgi:hypothetical protein